MPGWEKFAAHATHYALYALIFIIPLSGWLMSSAKGFQTVYLGVLPLPDFVPVDKALAELIKFSAYCLFVLLWTTLVYDPLAQIGRAHV